MNQSSPFLDKKLIRRGPGIVWEVSQQDDCRPRVPFGPRPSADVDQKMVCELQCFCLTWASARAPLPS